MNDPKAWLLGFGALALVGYLAAGTGIAPIVVGIFYLIAASVTYMFFQSGGLAKIQELL